MSSRPTVEFSRNPEPSQLSDSNSPPSAVPPPEERDWTRWWVGGGVLAAAMLGSGGFVGYRMQVSEAARTDSNPMEKYLKTKSPHPFLKEATKAKPVEPPMHVHLFAARGECRQS